MKLFHALLNALKVKLVFGKIIKKDFRNKCEDQHVPTHSVPFRRPSPTIPTSHVQSNDPTLFVHVALPTQLCVSFAHSSTSIERIVILTKATIHKVRVHKGSCVYTRTPWL